MHRSARLALRLMGIRLNVSGSSPSDSGIVIINHSSYIDVLVLCALLSGELVFIAKKELEPQLVAGPFLRALGTLFVDRADPEGGVEDTRKTSQAAEEGRTLVFFPEGTFTRAPGLLAFRLGAFVAASRGQLPILPATLRGTRSILRGDQWFPRHGSVSVHFGDPIKPEGTDFASAVRLRDEARAAILAACGEPDVAEC